MSKWHYEHEPWTLNIYIVIVGIFILFYFQFEWFDAHSLSSRQTVYSCKVSYLNMIINSLFFFFSHFSVFRIRNTKHWTNTRAYIFDVHTLLLTCIVKITIILCQWNWKWCVRTVAFAIKLVASCQAAKYTTNNRNSIQTSLNWIRNNVLMMIKTKRRSPTENDDT